MATRVPRCGRRRSRYRLRCLGADLDTGGRDGFASYAAQGDPSPRSDSFPASIGIGQGEAARVAETEATGAAPDADSRTDTQPGADTDREHAAASQHQPKPAGGAVTDDREACPACLGTFRVCENHPDRPWDGTSDSMIACGCGAGMPCPRCVLTGQSAPLPEGARVIAVARP